MKPVEFFTWEHTDPITGRRRRTRWKAKVGCITLRDLIDPTPIPETREVRELPETPEEFALLSAGDAVRISRERSKQR